MSTAFNYRNFPEPEPAPEPQKPEEKRHRGWRLLIWAAAGVMVPIVLGLLVVSALINTDGVHRAILNYAQKKASESLGVNVKLENFVVHWSTLSLDLYGISADGAGPHSSPPLLQVEHIRAGVRVVSVVHSKWYMDSLLLDHPVVWIYVDQNGNSNIPTFNSSKSSGSNNTLFDLGIRHAVLSGGEVYYNSRPSLLSADLHDLDLEATYNALRQTYSATVGYRDGRLQYGDFRPIQHNLDVNLDMTPSAIALKQAKLSSGNSQVALSANINNYENGPIVEAQYQVDIDGGQLGKLMNQTTLPTGMIRAAGNLQYHERPTLPLLQAITVNGELTSGALAVRTASARVEMSNLAAHYSLANGNATLRDLSAGVLGGSVTAQGTMTDLGGNSHSKFGVAIHDIQLAQARRLLGNAADAAGVGLAGTLNATATATWGKTINSLVAKTDAGIHANVSSRQKGKTKGSSATDVNLMDVANSSRTNAPIAESVPIDSEIHATYMNANGQLQLMDSYLRTAQTDLILNGTVSQHSSLVIRLQANDLREIALIANTFRMPVPNQQPIDLAGTASFQGNVQGSTTAPHLTGRLTAMNLHVNGSDWKMVRTDVDASPDHASMQNADLEPVTKGRITLNARAGLNKWEFNNDSPVQAEVRASQIALQDLTKFASQPIPVTGTLNTSVNLHGSVNSPEGNGNLLLTDVTAYQQPIQLVRVDFTGNVGEAQANLAMRMPGGSVQAKVTLRPKQRTFSAQLTSPGIHMDQLEVLKTRNIKAAGVLALNASGEGSLDNPQLAATVEVPSLLVSNQTISGVNLQLNMADHVAHASLNSSAMNTSLQAKATVQLTGDYMADGSLDTSVINLQPLLAIYSPDEAQNVSGETQVRATVHGPIKNLKELEAHLTIPVFKVAYQDAIQLAAASPIQVNYQHGVIDVPQGAIRGTGTDISFQGHIPTGNTEPMAVQLRGTLDMKLAQLFNPDVRSSGQIKLNIDSHGMLAKGSDIGGEIDVVNANFAEAGTPVGLQNGNGVLKLTTDRLNISSFQGTVGGGTVALQGGVAYRPNLVFDLGLSANGVRMLYPDGMRETINANIRLGGTTTQSVLGGNVDLTNLSFTPGFDLSNFAGQFSSSVEAPPSEGLAQNVKLNLAVRSTNDVNLVSRELSMNGSANLQVRGTAAEPVILGRVNLTGGDVILNGNRFVLTGGTIQFINPSQTEPVVNMTITTSIQEYKISLRFQGPVEQMKSEYSSDPSLPTADIIHLLAFGSTTEAAANNTTPANQEAESLVASQVSSQVTSRISKVAGISQLSVSPVLQGGTAAGPPGANVTIRQRVTGNLFITFSTNVATTQDQVIQGQYQVSPRVAVSGTRTPNGGFGVDALIKNTW